MPTEFSVNKRDIQFVLFEQLEMDDVCKLPVFEECNRELVEMVLAEAVKFGTEVLAPLNSVGDREGLKYENGEVITPPGFKEAYRQYIEGGWIGMSQNPEYGGQGLPNMLHYAVQEIFVGANMAFFLTSLLTEGAAHLIEKFGTDEQRKKYCEMMYTGKWGGTMCLTEPAAGSDVGALKTTAKRNGDHFLITGNKIFITSGEHDMVPNIIHPVLARIEGAPPGTKGISLFVVPKVLVNDDGSLGERNDMICGGIEHKMGIHASPTCMLNFGDEGKCKGWLLGEENTGMRAMFQMMNEARLGVATQGLGVAAAGYLSALGYAQERVQGAAATAGKDPKAPKVAIIEHPDLRRMLARMKCLVEGMRSLMYSVAKFIDLSIHSADEKDRSHYQNFVDLLIPICKSFGSDQGFRVNETAIQVYGGYGFCQEYPVEQYCRDQKITSIYEGTNGIQAMDLLGRKVIGSGGQLAWEFLDMVKEFTDSLKDDQELCRLAEKHSKAREELIEVSKALIEMAPKDPNYTFLRAVPYQSMFGHVVVSYFLLHAAQKASTSLQEIYKREGAEDEESRKKLLHQSSEAAFYHGRIASARFYVHNVLSEVYGLSSYILSGDISALEIVYPD